MVKHGERTCKMNFCKFCKEKETKYDSVDVEIKTFQDFTYNFIYCFVACISIRSNRYYFISNSTRSLVFNRGINGRRTIGVRDPPLFRGISKIARTSKALELPITGR